MARKAHFHKYTEIWKHENSLNFVQVAVLCVLCGDPVSRISIQQLGVQNILELEVFCCPTFNNISYRMGIMYLVSQTTREP